MKKFLIGLGAIVAFVLIAIMWGRSGDAPTRTDLVSQYPSIEEGSARAENKKILCPFLRMIERSGLLDEYKAVKDLQIGLSDLIKAAQTFGCGMLECGGVAIKASQGQETGLGQEFGLLSLEQLHKADGIAHDCGFTFAKGGAEVSDEVRAETLRALGQRAPDGKVSFQNILNTKKEICNRQNVEMSEPGLVEVKLIYAYLGGVDRGYVDLEDVKRLFHAEMPKYKTERWIRFDLFKELNKAVGLDK